MQNGFDISYQTPGTTETTRFEKIHNLSFKEAKMGSKAVAHEIACLVKQAKKKPVLGLATGSSPIEIYRELIRLHKNDGLSFKQVISFNLDEYLGLDSTHQNSYHHFMQEQLFRHIDLPKSQQFIPNGSCSEKDIEKECKAYEEKIKHYGGIDFQLLGIGRTGHIGFNEPGSHINSQTRLIHLDPITREDAANDFNGIINVPKKAITIGIKTILSAKRIVLVGWGNKKASIVAQVIEGNVNNQHPASYLQTHHNCSIVLDQEASELLTKHKTPWLVGQCKWTPTLKKKAIIWLSQRIKKPILQLTTKDYNENGLSDLSTTQGSAYELNIWMFNQLQSTITGWPGGKPKHDDHHRPERALPEKKRVLIFSPHPDDDVISMGGTLARLIDQGHKVDIAYQTSGNIAVSDEDAIKFITVAQAALAKENTEIKKLEDFKNAIRKGELDTDQKKRLLKIKGAIRASECDEAAHFLSLEKKHLHFLNLPFYETGEIIKNAPTEKDVRKTAALIKKLKPHQIFAAGDLADPHGTHQSCLEIIFKALKGLKNEPFIKDCWLWLYRGAWQEWPIEEIEMAVPLSPDQVQQKRNAILFHQSQKDKVMFQGEDNREFWLRAEQRNQKTAKTYNQLGMAEYKAIEAFKRYLY
ncbi:MAG: glucosamine-6-phosphate deaminase [Flavobacteriaceae bacterium]